MIKLGYTKDMISAIMFLIVFIIITINQKTLPLYVLQLGMIGGFMFDGAFSLWPRLHNCPIDDPKLGFVKYLLALFLLIFIFVMINMLYKRE
jgi:prepilin signal peptidase PulO-like enzyme (type II secretory pathway)